MSSAGYDDASVRGAGWVMFAAVLLFLAGIWNFIDGILAISSSHVFVGNAHFVFSDLKTWGWIVMILGIVQLAAGAGLLSGATWARWFAIAMAALNAFGQLAFMPAYPFWAILMFTLNILIIFGLVAYGKSVKALDAY
jgi:hypothetical protein